MNEKPELNLRGYMVLQMLPGKFRVRGLYTYIDFWPNMMLHKRAGSRTMVPYASVIDTVLDPQYHFLPYEVPTEEQRQATLEWRAGLEELHDRMACMRLSTHGIC